MRIDLGGIGKGYAADLIAAELIAAGAEGVSVNLGGDLRVAGVAPGAQPWGSRSPMKPPPNPTLFMWP